jgi:hypothetical protein
MRKYAAPVDSGACRLGICVGQSTQTADTRVSTGLLRLEFERFREGNTIAPAERQRKNGQEIPEATWKPHESHGRLTMETDLSVFSKFDRKMLEFMAEALRDGKLVIPISETVPLRQAAEAQAAAEKGVAGKILLVA